MGLQNRPSDSAASKTSATSFESEETLSFVEETPIEKVKKVAKKPTGAQKVSEKKEAGEEPQASTSTKKTQSKKASTEKAKKPTVKKGKAPAEEESSTEKTKKTTKKRAKKEASVESATEPEAESVPATKKIKKAEEKKKTQKTAEEGETKPKSKKAKSVEESSEEVAGPSGVTKKGKTPTKKTKSKSDSKDSENGKQKTKRKQKRTEEVAESDESQEEQKDKVNKKRPFKLMTVHKDGDGNDVVVERGRYYGNKPRQAASKACTNIFRTAKQENPDDIPDTIHFAMHECAKVKKNKRKFYYTGTYNFLVKPETLSIYKKDPTTGEYCLDKRGNKIPELDSHGEPLVVTYGVCHRTRKMVDPENNPVYHLLKNYEKPKKPKASEE